MRYGFEELSYGAIANDIDPVRNCQLACDEDVMMAFSEFMKMFDIQLELQEPSTICINCRWFQDKKDSTVRCQCKKVVDNVSCPKTVPACNKNMQGMNHCDQFRAKIALSSRHGIKKY
jgi:hypothetical protein